MYGYKIIRSGRKTLAIQVLPDLSVVVRAPYRASNREILGFAEKNTQWVEKTKRRIQAEREKPSEPKFTEEQIRELAREALEKIPPRAEALAAAVGVSYNRITIRNQLTRWGSCSSLGNLNFNCLLMLCPQEVVDYVIIHELCHRRHMDHSPEFWAEVERHCPEYKACRSYLKNQAAALIARLR